jgi:hypothetical protein
VSSLLVLRETGVLADARGAPAEIGQWLMDDHVAPITAAITIEIIRGLQKAAAPPLARARTFTAVAYTDPDYFELEKWRACAGGLGIWKSRCGNSIASLPHGWAHAE